LKLQQSVRYECCQLQQYAFVITRRQFCFLEGDESKLVEHDVKIIGEGKM
jgi:hypothetical protein